MSSLSPEDEDGPFVRELSSLSPEEKKEEEEGRRKCARCHGEDGKVRPIVAARPPVATERLSRLPDGRLLYRLKRRWRDGTTHVVFEPVELVEKLAALHDRLRTVAAFL